MADLFEPIDKAKRELAIENIDSNILVSASAGSGKTHLMTQKVGAMVSGDVKKRFAISNLMIVTFTKASAKELKTRVSDKLLETIQLLSAKCKKTADPKEKQELEERIEFLKMQMEDLPLASISTIDSLCSQIVRQYFQQAQVDPAFIVMEEDEAGLLFNKAVSNALREYNEKPSNAYLKLIKFFGDNNLKEAISTAYKFIRNNTNYEEYFEEKALYTYNVDLDKSEAAINYFASIKDEFKEHAAFIDYLKKQQANLDPKTWDKIKDAISQADSYVASINNATSIKDLIQRLNAVEKFASTPTKAPSENDEGVYEGLRTRLKGVTRAIQVLVEKLTGFDYDEEVKNKEIDRELVKEFVGIIRAVDKEYTEIKREENKVDFNDLEQKVAALLENEDILATLQDKYEYLFIDECQDVNPLQDYIMRTISNGNNLFMVGDIKQSIYGFRLSDPTLFLDRYKAYLKNKEDGLAIELNTNFRSRQSILDFVNDVFKCNMTTSFGGIDYLNSAMLNPIGTKAEQKQQRTQIAIFSEDEKEIDFHLEDDLVYSVKNHEDAIALNKNDKEAQYVIEKIKEIVGSKRIVIDKNGNKEETVYQYSDIAILFEGRTKEVNNIVNKVRQSGIPIDTSNAMVETKNHEISLLISLLNIIDNDKQDVPLTNVLLSVFGGFTAAELAIINAATPRIEDKVENFHQVFKLYEKNDELFEKIKKFESMLERYRFASRFMSVADLLEKIIDENMFDEYVLAQDNGESSLNQIKTFIKGLRGRGYNSSISKFLSTYREYDSIDTTKEVFNISADCVKTSTIHGSKGLQYPVVFVVNINKQQGGDTDKFICQKQAGIVFKHFDEETLSSQKCLPHQLTTWAKNLEEKQEKLRLLYVALTRAEEKLYITGMDSKPFPKYKDIITDSNGAIKGPKDASTMYFWLQYASTTVPNFRQDYFDKSCEGFELKQMDEEQAIKPFDYSIKDNEFVSKLNDLTLDNYEYKESTQSPLWYSVTQLNKDGIEDEEIDLPQDMFVDIETFFGDNLETSPKAGTAYHKVLELLDFDKEYTIPELEGAIEEMHNSGELDNDQYMIVNAKVIKSFLDSDFMKEIKGRQKIKEQSFRMYSVIPKEILGKDIKDKVLLQGTFDLFIPRENGKESILIDYKYSKKTPEEIYRTYKKQILLYKLAIDKCMHEDVDKMFIYVIGQDVCIEIK